MLHGIQSHSGWYARSASWLAEKGIAVVAPDRRGSGMNIPDRGHAPSWELLVDDVVRVTDSAFSTEPDVPIHLMGISWGAKLAAAAILAHPARYESVIFSGPGFCPVCDLPAADKLRVGLGLMGDRRRYIPIPIGRGEMFTGNPTWARFIDGDPLTLRSATAGFFWESRKLDRHLARRIKRIENPAALFLGSDDRIIDEARTRAFFDRPSYYNSRIHYYEGAGHTLEFEPDPSDYLSDLLGWVRFDPGFMTK